MHRKEAFMTKRFVKSTVALLIVAVCMFTSSFGIIRAAAPQETITIGLLYDESFAYHYGIAGFTNHAAIESLLLQLGNSIAIPFRKTLNVNLEFKVYRYDDLFGQSYAEQYGEGCLWDWEINSVTSRSRKVWQYSLCNDCDERVVSNHHSSANYYVDTMSSNFPSYNEEGLDAIALFVGHKLCHSDNPCNKCDGLSSMLGNVFVMDGVKFLFSGNFNTPIHRDMYNLQLLKRTFWHEFGHNLGLCHVYQPYWYTHTPNSPCCQGIGYEQVVYLENNWCDVCRGRLDYSHLINHGNTVSDNTEVSYTSCSFDDDADFFVLNSVSDYENFIAESSAESSYENIASHSASDAEFVDAAVFNNNQTSVTFDYSSRLVPLVYDYSDTITRAMFSYQVTVEFKPTPSYFVTDMQAFAQYQASHIGATQSIAVNGAIGGTGYIGEAYASVKMADGTYQRTLVGRSVVYASTNGNSYYTYYPATVSLQEIQAILAGNS